jgi:hypothetical protein
MKKSISLLLIIGMICISSINIFAHEVFSSYPHRWDNIDGYSYYPYHAYCILKTNGSLLNSNWSSPYTSSIYNWNNYSDLYVSATDTDFTQSEVDLYTYSTWPSNYPVNGIAKTDCYDDDGDKWDNSDFTPNSNCDTNIVSASIGTNPKYNSDTALSQYNKRYAIAHEMGHVLGLGHPEDTVESLMHKDTSRTWSDYDLPKNHERTDLADFY